MNRPAASPRPCEGGFVLIGVIIFVLALTIIGISLFSLSTYEAQFLQRSQDGEQAFQSALGGIERAKFILSSTSQLENVPRFMSSSSHQWNMVSASAGQIHGSDTIRVGSVDWDDPDQGVVLRVTAQVNEEQRTIVARFTPDEAPSYYRRLITTGNGIEVRGISASQNSHGEYTPRSGTVFLDGAVWESSGRDTMDWLRWLGGRPSIPIQRSPGVPIPDVTSFVALHQTLRGPQVRYLSPDSKRYTLRAWSNTPTYRMTDDTSDPTWSLHDLYTIHTIEIRVQGCVVWLLPRGVRFDHEPVIHGMSGNGRDCLVIVAGHSLNSDYHQFGLDSAGIWFQGGLQADIPVVLVSDGKVVLWHDNEYSGMSVNSRASDLSVFARSVSLMGPEQTNRVDLAHPTNGYLETTFLPLLFQRSALPNSGSTSGHTLDLVSGTWRTSTP